MMIRITKNEILHYADGDKNNRKLIGSVNSLIPFLNNIIEFDEDVTLNTIFDIIRKDTDIYNQVFSSHLGHHDINIYLNDADKKQIDNEEISAIDKIEYLQILWNAELFTFNDGTTDFTFYVDFCGFGKYILPDTNDMTDMNYAIEYISLNILKNYCIKLDTKFQIQYSDPFNKKEKNKYRKGIQVESDFSVYDVVGTILDEISFMGTPYKRNKANEELLDRVKDYKKNPKNIPWENKK